MQGDRTKPDSQENEKHKVRVEQADSEDIIVDEVV